MYLSEISASLYPWDLADEGVERILDNLEEMTACNSVYLVGLMHHEKRPLTDYFYPHNPVRRTYFPEDSRAYWNPTPSFYGRIKPLTSERAFLQDTDWLETLIKAARRRRMRTGVEISHTVVDAERAAGELADCMQYDIYGQRLGNWSGAGMICFNNPDARDYVMGLFSDLVTQYDLDFIQTCLIPFHAGKSAEHPAVRLLGVVLGGCFCPHCRKAAAERGLDLGQVQARLLPLADSVSHSTLEQTHELALLGGSNVSPTEILLQHPDLYQWLQFRRDSLTRFFEAIHRRIHGIRSDIDLRLNAYISQNQELAGLDLRALKPYVDSVRSSDYSEQSGDPARLEHKRRWLLAIRRAVGEEKPVLSAIGVRPKATPELIRQGVLVSAQCGIDGLTIGHYDGASYSNLRAIKEGSQLADVEL